MRSVFLGVLGISALCHNAVAALPGTRPLTVDGDRSTQMVTGISRFLDRQIESAAQQRSQQQLDPIAARKQLRKAIGAVDPLLSLRDSNSSPTPRVIPFVTVMPTWKSKPSAGRFLKMSMVKDC